MPLPLGSQSGPGQRRRQRLCPSIILQLTMAESSRKQSLMRSQDWQAFWVSSVSFKYLVATSRELLADLHGSCLPYCAGSRQAPYPFSALCALPGGYGSDDDEEDDEVSGDGKQQQERDPTYESRDAGAQRRADERQAEDVPGSNVGDSVRGSKAAEEEAVDYD